MDASLLSLLADLEMALAAGNPARHIQALNAITGLFVTSADSLARTHVTVYDAVLQRLLSVADPEARAGVARALAPVPNAPRGSIVLLACDAIDVARPVLRHSEALEEADLVAIAAEADQPHLLAISRRRHLGETVTDLLIERGDAKVLHATAGNAGAAISEQGFGMLVARSDRDPLLQQVVGLRADLPPHHFKLLIEKAAREVRVMLVQHAGRENLRALDRLVGAATAQLDLQAAADVQARRRGYAAAIDTVTALVQDGRLDEATLVGFARSGETEAAVCALSALTRLPLDAVETAMNGERSGGLVLIVRALNFTWPTAQALLRLRPGGLPSRGGLDALEAEFQGMTPATARRALRFMVTRDGGRAAMMAA